MRTVLWFMYFVGYLLAILPRYFKGNKLKKMGRQQECDDLVADVVHKWASRLLWAAGAQITVTGRENIPKDEAVLFIANHQSNFDIPIMLSCMDKPHPLLSKMEVGKIPLIKQWMLLLNCVFLERDNPRRAVESLNEVAELVNSGYSYTIFPEGTRSKGKAVGEFKSGAFKIASKTKVKLVPVAIEGSYKLMEANNSFIKPAKVTVKILPPINSADFTREEQRQLPELLKSVIVAAKEEHTETTAQ